MTPAQQHSQDFLESVASDQDVTFNYHRRSLRFRVSQELFSSYQIDTGTRLLLKTVSELAVSNSVRKVLDLGCGYGPLGLALAAVEPGREVHLVDRDALAVEFTRSNAQLNGLSNVKVYGSLGYDDLPDSDFDLILCNIPGKIGRPAIGSLLLDARRFLQAEGIVAIVVVPPLAPFVDETLNRPEITRLLREEGSEHVVFHYRFNNAYHSSPADEKSAFDRGVYDRGQMDVDYGARAGKHARSSERGRKFSIQTVRGVPEFDSLSHQTELLLSGLQKMLEKKKGIDQALIFNPGQGHVPVALWKLFSPLRMTLVDRDLLSLRAAERNLLANGCPRQKFTLLHKPGLPAGEASIYDLILGALHDSEGPAAHYIVIEQAAALLVLQGEVLVSGSSTTITRLEKSIKEAKLLTVKQRRRNRAKRMLWLSKQ